MNEPEREGETATADDATEATETGETSTADDAGGGVRRWLLVAALALALVALVARWRRGDGDAGLEAPF